MAIWPRVAAPTTRFVSIGDDRIAFHMSGQGPVTLVIVYGTYSHIQLNWEIPAVVRMLERLGQFVTVVEFDRRGTGLSDRPDRPLTIEDRVDEVLAVIDAAADGPVALLGVSDGAATAVVLAASRPDRVSRLLLYAPLVRTLRSADFPWGTFESRQELVTSIDDTLDQWGEASASRRMFPGATETELELLARCQRMAITPKGAFGMLGWPRSTSTFVLCFQPYQFLPWCYTRPPILSFLSGRAVISQPTSRERRSWSSRVPRTYRQTTTSVGSSTRSSDVSLASHRARTSTACSPPCSSPIWSRRRKRRPPGATGGGSMS
jgi:pimeloyl-ACP methyl ester carboxylesterase